MAANIGFSFELNLTDWLTVGVEGSYQTGPVVYDVQTANFGEYAATITRPDADTGFLPDDFLMYVGTFYQSLTHQDHTADGVKYCVGVVAGRIPMYYQLCGHVVVLDQCSPHPLVCIGSAVVPINPFTDAQMREILTALEGRVGYNAGARVKPPKRKGK